MLIYLELIRVLIFLQILFERGLWITGLRSICPDPGKDLNPRTKLGEMTRAALGLERHKPLPGLPLPSTA